MKGGTLRLGARMPTAALALLIAAAAVPLAASTETRNEPFRSSPLATLRWNEISRAVVRRNLVDPLWATGTYALISVAQDAAARAITRAHADGGERPRLVAAAIASSSAATLVGIYPHEAPSLGAQLHLHLRELRAGATSPARFERAVAAGKSVAISVLRERANDGATSLEVVEAPAVG